MAPLGDSQTKNPYQLNNIEKRTGDQRLPVDGFHVQKQTAYQFHGCYWHGHDCALNQGKDFNAECKKSIVNMIKKTRAHKECIRGKDYGMVERWGCQWQQMKRTDCELQRFIGIKVRGKLD